MPIRLRLTIATASGVIAGLVLVGVMAVSDVESVTLFPAGSTNVQFVLHLVVAIAIGALVGAIFDCRPRAYASLLSSGLVVGMLWWILGPLTLASIVDGDAPTWSLDEATLVFPNLVSSLLFGGVLGLVYGLIGIPQTTSAPPTAVDGAAGPRVVVLGAGFGGLAVAQRLEHHATRGSDLDVTLVSASNSLLFTPMLAEVASSSLDAQHISAPIRAAVPRTRFVRGRVATIDTDERLIRLADPAQPPIPYDHLVLALGSVPDYRDLPGVEANSFALKSLTDATRLRNHVIEMLERADAETDPDERRRRLTFVVAGGGFAGTEMIAELLDLAHSTLRYYPGVPEDELRFVLVHSRDRILPEIGPELADYALRKLRERGVEFRLGVRVRQASPSSVTLGDGTVLETRTFVWTAGNRPHPVLASLPCERNRAGALVAESTMQVAGHDRLWAVGDCAQIPDPDNEGASYPPTAQHALREGKALADNIVAATKGRPVTPFRFETIGILVALGHRTAVAEIRGRRFSGLLAWFLWRGIYLAKLPGLEKKTRVTFDWTLDLLFPRDIVQTATTLPTPAPPPPPPSSTDRAAGSEPGDER